MAMGFVVSVRMPGLLTPAQMPYGWQKEQSLPVPVSLFRVIVSSSIYRRANFPRVPES
jgi:hypothetical protein